MQNWPAYIDLKKKIDDFNNSCPLLELMTSNAMKERHWTRMETLLKHKFDVVNPNFSLGDVMQAPLLKFKDDIEVSGLNFERGSFSNGGFLGKKITIFNYKFDKKMHFLRTGFEPVTYGLLSLLHSTVHRSTN
jgi:hypothetical protein